MQFVTHNEILTCTCVKYLTRQFAGNPRDARWRPLARDPSILLTKLNRTRHLRRAVRGTGRIPFDVENTHTHTPLKRGASMRLPACVETRITSPVTSARERMNRVCHRGVFSPAAQDWFEALSAKSVWFTDNNQLNVSRSTWLVTVIIINMLIFYLAWYCTRCSAPRSSAPWSSAPAHCSTSLFLPFAAGCLQRAAADASCTRIPSWPRMVVTTLAPLDVACCSLTVHVIVQQWPSFVGDKLHLIWIKARERLIVWCQISF